jgi:hypothetical protein
LVSVEEKERAQVKGFVAKNNITFRLKDAKELTYAAFGKIHVPDIFGIGFDVTFIRCLPFSSVYYT